MLAAAEHLTHQAITQTLSALKAAGLVRAVPDASDRRKSVIRVTAAGNRLYESAIASRDAWLAAAVDRVVAPRERAARERSIQLLERLAEASHPERCRAFTVAFRGPPRPLAAECGARHSALLVQRQP